MTAADEDDYLSTGRLAERYLGNTSKTSPLALAHCLCAGRCPAFTWEDKGELDMSDSSAISTESDLRYPVGKFHASAAIAAEDRAAWMKEVDNFPQALQKTITGLSETQLDTPYRPGGWTVRQVVHHLADSHINSYIRFRLAMTEDRPTIKPYDEAAWAELADSKVARVELSLHLLEALHARWGILLRSFKGDDFARVFIHPERGEMSLDFALGLYAWHGRHHLAQILSLRERQAW